MATKLQKAKKSIFSFFEQKAQGGLNVHSYTDLVAVLKEHREAGKLRKDFKFRDFVEFLEKEGSLRKEFFHSVTLKPQTRYAWGEASVFEKALSLYRNSYLSHGTAVYLHQLNDQIPRTIYVNHEQSPKHFSSTLTQEDINQAFSRQERKTSASFLLGKTEIVIINGKHSGGLEVGEIESPEGEFLRCTKLERTLIDIVVRPRYAGGIYQVLKAYETAKDRAAVNVLVATLKSLNFLYPYHQAIGFLMDRAGYGEARTKRLQALGVNFDFYLIHGMGQKIEFDKKWRLFYPAGF